MPSLLSPNVRAITLSSCTPQRDRAPDALAAGTPHGLRDGLTRLLGADRVLCRPIDLIRFATDASPYRLFPKVVVVARNLDDVRKVLDYAREKRGSVTFRSAGTSLSGQAQGDGILVEVKRHWTGTKVEAKGNACVLALAPYWRVRISRFWRTVTALAPIQQAHRPARLAALSPTIRAACVVVRRRTPIKHYRRSRLCCRRAR